jgi:hypothetical protein
MIKSRLPDGRLAAVSPLTKPLYRAPAYPTASVSTVNLASLAAVTMRLAGVIFPEELMEVTE